MSPPAVAVGRADSPAYTGTAIVLHWAIAVLILAAFPLGLYMSGLAVSPTKLRLFSYHKWIGVTVAALAAVRLAWRLSHRPPALPASMGRNTQRAAHAVHWVLYVLMFAVPVVGWLMSSALGFQTVWFGIVPLPDLIGRSKPVAAVLLDIHAVLAWTLLASVAGHGAAALRHHWVAGDDVLTRMLPSLSRRS